MGHKRLVVLLFWHALASSHLSLVSKLSLVILLLELDEEVVGDLDCILLEDLFYFRERRHSEKRLIGQIVFGEDP